MSKVLFITNIKIDSFGGGSISSKRFVDYLKWAKNEGEIQEYGIISLDNYPCNIGVDITKSRKKDILARFLGHSNYLFLEIKKQIDKIVKFKPDIVYIENSRLGFVSKFIKKHLPRAKIITNFENIEVDYCKRAVSKLNYPIEAFVVRKDEALSIKYSDDFIFLTERDRNRASFVYKHDFSKSLVFPITVDVPRSPLIITSKKPTIVMLGSLNYLPNEDACLFFIKKVLPRIDRDQFDFVIAGKNPGSVLIDQCELNGIKLIPGFDRLSDFCPKGACLISPLLSGAGMKTKVAEALSYGMYIIGSEETFVGYEALFRENLKYIDKATTIDEYVSCIRKYYDSYNNSKLDIEETNVLLFKKYYLTSSYFNKIKDGAK